MQIYTKNVKKPNYFYVIQINMDNFIKVNNKIYTKNVKKPKKWEGIFNSIPPKNQVL